MRKFVIGLVLLFIGGLICSQPVTFDVRNGGGAGVGSETGVCFGESAR